MHTTTVTSSNTGQVLTELEQRTAESSPLRLVIPDAGSVFSTDTARWASASQLFHATNVELDVTADRWALTEFGGSAVLREACKTLTSRA